MPARGMGERVGSLPCATAGGSDRVVTEVRVTRARTAAMRELAGSILTLFECKRERAQASNLTVADVNARLKCPHPSLD
jgi:hypothetical protein